MADSQTYPRMPERPNGRYATSIAHRDHGNDSSIQTTTSSGWHTSIFAAHRTHTSASLQSVLSFAGLEVRTRAALAYKNRRCKSPNHQSKPSIQGELMPSANDIQHATETLDLLGFSFSFALAAFLKPRPVLLFCSQCHGILVTLAEKKGTLLGVFQ